MREADRQGRGVRSCSPVVAFRSLTSESGRSAPGTCPAPPGRLPALLSHPARAATRSQYRGAGVPLCAQPPLGAMRGRRRAVVVSVAMRDALRRIAHCSAMADA